MSEDERNDCQASHWWQAECVHCQHQPEYVCGTCGEPDGSVYAKRCCTTDNMIEA